MESSNRLVSRRSFPANKCWEAVTSAQCLVRSGEISSTENCWLKLFSPDLCSNFHIDNSLIVESVAGGECYLVRASLVWGGVSTWYLVTVINQLLYKSWEREGDGFGNTREIDQYWPRHPGLCNKMTLYHWLEVRGVQSSQQSPTSFPSWVVRSLDTKDLRTRVRDQRCLL